MVLTLQIGIPLLIYITYTFWPRRGGNRHWMAADWENQDLGFRPPEKVLAEMHRERKSITTASRATSNVAGNGAAALDDDAALTSTITAAAVAVPEATPEGKRLESDSQ